MPKVSSGTQPKPSMMHRLSLIHIYHGNAEKMMNPDGTPFTAHTTNVVPFVAVGCGDVKLREGGCLADIAPDVYKRQLLTVAVN